MTHPVITLTPVESSQLHSIGHDAATNTLAIRFLSKGGPGSLYHYANFTAEDFAAFLDVESKGSFFKRYIKINPNRYPYTKIDESTPTLPESTALAAAKSAIAAVLRRIQSDPRVAFYICPATETYDQVVAAHCAMNGLDEADFRRAFEPGLQFEAPPERA
jgi:hypothetical protein